jgi:hypothetical protein
MPCYDSAYIGKGSILHAHSPALVSAMPEVGAHPLFS